MKGEQWIPTEAWNECLDLDLPPGTCAFRDGEGNWQVFEIKETKFMVHRSGAVRTPRNPRRTVAAVEVIRVHPLVMREALRLAQGDARRLSIVDASTVIVR